VCSDDVCVSSRRSSRKARRRCPGFSGTGVAAAGVAAFSGSAGSGEAAIAAGGSGVCARVGAPFAGAGAARASIGGGAGGAFAAGAGGFAGSGRGGGREAMVWGGRVGGLCRSGGCGGSGPARGAMGSARGAAGGVAGAGFAIGSDGVSSGWVGLRPNRRRRNSMPTVGPPDRAPIQPTDNERRCGREGASADHLRGSGLMASPRLRREEPWRGYALKAPPRRSTGALLAGCEPARPLRRLYHRAPRTCQPQAVEKHRSR